MQITATSIKPSGTVEGRPKFGSLSWQSSHFSVFSRLCPRRSPQRASQQPASPYETATQTSLSWETLRPLKRARGAHSGALVRLPALLAPALLALLAGAAA